LLRIMRASKEVPLTEPPFGAFFLASVQWPLKHLLFEVPPIWYFFLIFEVPMSTMVTHYESQQGGAVDGTPLWDIFLASVQRPFRHLLS
jgi:hypothetical protein